MPTQTLLPNNIQGELTTLEQQLLHAQDTAALSAVKSQLSNLQQQLNLCQKNAQAELDALSQLRSESRNERTENLELTTVKNKDIQASEMKSRNNLLECKYYLLKLSQLNSQYISTLSAKRLTDYWHASAIYHAKTDVASDKAAEQLSQITKLAWLLLGYLALLLPVLIFIIIRPSKGQDADYRPLLMLFAISLLSALTIPIDRQWHFSAYDHTWLFFTSMILLPCYASDRHSLPGKLAIGLVLLWALASSLLLQSPLIWQVTPLLHGIITASALIAAALLLWHTDSRVHRHAILLLCVATTLLEILEYHTLAHQILILLYLMLLLQSVHYAIWLIVGSTMSVLKRGKTVPLKKIRRNMSISPAVVVPGSGWLKWSVYFSLLIASFMSLLDYSGLPESLIALLTQVFSDGFTIGTVSINPKNLLSATFVFSTLLIISWIIRQRIESNYQKKDLNASDRQNAKAALFWYSAVAFSALSALSISGFKVENLAIVAGAFSVGIGFGLQNIVSNFISGIILLIERPVKPNDWVEISGVQGFVEKINIRATHIKTFDNSDIMVPNSEFISNHVKNMMFEDSIGRLHISVGVAYGSDTRLVLSLLEQVVRDHESVLSDDEEFPYSVIFTEFGESSLNFEIRCFIKEIRRILDVKSDLHFAIDDIFRKHHIEIPFPQRDIHVKHLPTGSDNV